MDFSFLWKGAGHDLARLMIAYLLALPVGWNREKEAHSVGVRTFPLVAMASCGYVMLAMPQYGNSIEAQSRVIQGMVAGIGFIGGGAILKSEGNVHGTATAASIWNIGVIGAAVAEDRILIAALLSAMNLVALRILMPLKQKLDERREERQQTKP
jgi:putative Mg2+ transporter-C (MgtC) family protein